MKHRGLGKGLSALLKEEVASIDNELVKFVDIDNIEPGIYQPRKNFEHEKIQELADSIAKSGLLQPIIVSPKQDGKYKIIAGERRWRACKLAAFSDIPVIIKDIDNREILRIALIENIQREELSPIEEAEGFARLINEFNYTQEQLAGMLSKSRSHVANILRLNQLSPAIKNKVINGQLTMGHARCLIGHNRADAIADYIIHYNLNVRQAESLVKSWGKKQGDIGTVTRQKNTSTDIELLAQSLSSRFSIKITLEDNHGRGKLVFNYENLEQLDTILSRLN